MAHLTVHVDNLSFGDFEKQWFAAALEATVDRIMSGETAGSGSLSNPLVTYQFQVSLYEETKKEETGELQNRS